MDKILVVAPSWVGDAILSQPLLMRLRERNPGAALDVLAPPWTAPAYRHMPEVAEVIEHPFRHGRLGLTARYRLGQRLRAARYRQAVVLPNSLKSALAPWFAGIPLRTGFVGEFRHGLLNDARKLDARGYPLMVERFALLAEKRGVPLARPLPRPQLRVGAAEQEAARGRLGLPAGPAAILCPGAEFGPAKRWPARHFGALAARLTAAGYRVWAVGSPKDAATGEAVGTASGGACANLCGRTSLAEAIALIAGAAVVVSNDSGLMHVAAACGRPLVALYGSSSPGFTPPLSERARVLQHALPCQPCFQRECPLGHLDCLTQLTPEEVFASIQTP